MNKLKSYKKRKSKKHKRHRLSKSYKRRKSKTRKRHRLSKSYKRRHKRPYKRLSNLNKIIVYDKEGFLSRSKKYILELINKFNERIFGPKIKIIKKPKKSSKEPGFYNEMKNLKNEMNNKNIRKNATQEEIFDLLTKTNILITEIQNTKNLSDNLKNSLIDTLIILLKNLIQNTKKLSDDSKKSYIKDLPYNDKN
jgi:hypothetical protein